MKRIMLSGPSPRNEEGAYGGGQGGYTRNVEQYLNAFVDEEYQLILCPCSIRKPGKYYFVDFPRRLINDIFRYAKSVKKVDAVHILAQYRGAIYREFIFVLIANILKKPVLYDIKAGVFIEWYNLCGPSVKRIVDYILKSAKILFCEGLPYVKFLSERGLNALYFPNFLDVTEVYENPRGRLKSSRLKLLFVGYCYEGKGVYELVEGVNIASKMGVSLSLTLLGKESKNFSKWVDCFESNESGCVIQRKGRVSHDVVMRQMAQNDVFIIPSRHSGEGHNNSINEAMISGMVVAVTDHGFLEDVVGEDCGYIIKPLNAQSIAKTVQRIDENRDEALKKAAKGKRRVIDNYSSEKAAIKMKKAYRDLLK